MKTGKRSYPLDQLSVSEDGVSVSIHTHRQKVVMSVIVEGFGEHRLDGDFNDLLRMVKSYIKNHDEGFFYSPPAK